MKDYAKKTTRESVQQNNAPVQAKTNGIPNSVLSDVLAGNRKADSSMMGHQQNLAPSIAAKMSRSFGMDLTGMQVYRSDAMVSSGMQGMAQGNKVVLSSDIDLNTTAGQAVLGHEISHIHAQSQGIGMGHSGLYENAALEHQADTEGLLAAQGRSIYQGGGMDMGGGMQYGLGMQGVEGMTTLGGGMSASAGAPMQAAKDETNEIKQIYQPSQSPKTRRKNAYEREVLPFYTEEQIKNGREEEEAQEVMGEVTKGQFLTNPGQLSIDLFNKVSKSGPGKAIAAKNFYVNAKNGDWESYKNMFALLKN